LWIVIFKPLIKSLKMNQGAIIGGIIGLLVGVVISLSISFTKIKKEIREIRDEVTAWKSIEFEIYTRQDIYYIQPLKGTVTSESGLVDLKFSQWEDLSQWLSKQTAKDVRNEFQTE